MTNDPKECVCTGPQNGEALCPCAMRSQATNMNARWTKCEVDSPSYGDMMREFIEKYKEYGTL